MKRKEICQTHMCLWDDWRERSFEVENSRKILSSLRLKKKYEVGSLNLKTWLRVNKKRKKDAKRKRAKNREWKKIWGFNEIPNPLKIFWMLSEYFRHWYHKFCGWEKWHANSDNYIRIIFLRQFYILYLWLITFFT